MIPVNEPLFQGNEKKYLNQCIETGWISSEGSFVTRFEDQFSKKVDRNFAVSVCNGTAALQLSVEALDIGKGDEVILPSFSIISCAASVVRCGAVPVLVDSLEDTFNINPDLIEEKITAKTRAIIVVHTYGLPADMEPILKIALKYKLKVIEDAAEVIGQTYNGKPCGSFGDVSIFSFYANKHITTGEGGMVLTNNFLIAQRCRSLRNLCFLEKQRFLHKELGWNYRMTNLQAAVGLAQLENLPQTIKRKRDIGNLYIRLLGNLTEIKLAIPKTSYADNIFWVNSVVISKKSAKTAKSVANQLQTMGIGTRPFFWPMHQQPVFKKMGLFEKERYPVAEHLAVKGFYLPSGLALTDQQIVRVSQVVKKIFH